MRDRETTIQHAIMRHIGSRPYLRLWRQNVGVAQVADRVIRFGQPGAADLTGVLACGMRLELEVKRPGGKQSPAQVAFQGVMDSMNALYAVVDSPESADLALASHVDTCSVCGRRTAW